MRINPSSENKQPEPQQSKATTRSVAQQGEPIDGVNVSHTGSQNFASILDRVAKPKDKERDKDFKENDGARSKETNSREESEEVEDLTQPVSEENKEAKRDKESGGESGGFGQMSGGLRETFVVSSDAVSARAILHIADLERIVSAIRSKIQAGGQREVLIELKNSVLEGLKIRLSTNSENRVSAELIASSERVKTQLDARLTDLSDLLRSRGVTLAELKTSLGSNQSNDNKSDANDNGRAHSSILQNQRVNHANINSHDTTAGISIDEENNGATYRA